MQENLRAAFMAGAKSGVTAHQVFTDRVNEQTAFADSFTAMRAALTDSPDVVDDLSAGRRNLLVYYGVGGVGKSTLSRKLEANLTTLSSKRPVTSIRIDFDDLGNSDIESVVLRLRAGLGQLGGHWQAFDTALAGYWAQAHPGEPLGTFVDKSPLLKSVSQRFNLSDQIVESLTQASGLQLSGVAGLAQWSLLEASRAIRSRIREKTLFADCDMYEHLVSAEADAETISYFAYLLAWDLRRIRGTGTEGPRVVVFMDTFERLGNEFDLTFYRQLQRVIYLLPNVLFVATGRNRIDWAELPNGSELDFTGVDRWPNLHFENVTVEPRQHLVGYLSDEDAGTYLASALRNEDSPAINLEIRRRIIEGAQGLPLYLDLSVSHFAAIVGSGRSPEVEDFGGPLVAVATRSMRDLKSEERELVRAASLVARFDEDMLVAALPGVSRGRISRFLTRPFHSRDDEYQLPYSLHASLRDAIVDADEQLPDGWSSGDRVQIGGRIFDSLGTRALNSAELNTSSLMLDLGMELSNRFGCFDEWLVKVSLNLIDGGAWGYLPMIEARTVTEPKLQELQLLVRGVLLRRSGEPQRSDAVLGAVKPNELATPILASAIRIHRAHTLRNLGRYSEASELYAAEVSGPMAEEANVWLADYAYLNGRFVDALRGLESVQPEGPLGREAARLRGHIARVNGDFARAVSIYASTLEGGRLAGDIPSQSKALVGLAQTYSWTGERSRLVEVVSEAQHLLDLLPNPVESVKLQCADAISWIVAGDFPAARVAIDETRAMTGRAQYVGGRNLEDLALAALNYRLGDRPGARAAILRMQQRTAHSHGNGFWVPIARAFSDDDVQLSDDGLSLQWLGGWEQVRSAWRGVWRQQEC